MSGSTSLKVNTEQLVTYGGDLVGLQVKIDNCLDELNRIMTGISDAWKDDDGLEFKTKFDTFIKEAKKIDVELGALGAYAVKVAGKYDTILAESIRMMGD